MRNTWTVVYRTGGTALCQWRRVFDTYTDESAARKVAEEIERGGRCALVFISRQLETIGMPEGWDSSSPRADEACHV